MPIYLLSQNQELLQHWKNCWEMACVELDSLEEQLPEQAIVIMDLAIPQTKNWTANQWREFCKTNVLIGLNSLPSDEEGHYLLSLGARGYGHAFASTTLLQQMLAVVQAGDIWAGRSLVQRILQAIKRIPARPPTLVELSAREKETAHYAGIGLSNKEIARKMNISERTVKAHLSQCYDKLQVTDRVQLALCINGLA